MKRSRSEGSARSDLHGNPSGRAFSQGPSTHTSICFHQAILVPDIICVQAPLALLDERSEA